MSDPAPGPSVEPVPCARHHDVQTLLRCSRCDAPICPKCLVHGPVGARCPDCASPLRLLAPSRTQYAAATAAGLGVGALGGALLGFVGFGGLGLLVVGLAVGEVVSRAGGRRGGTTLAVVAFFGAVVGPLLGRAAVIALLVPLPDLGMRLALMAQVMIPLMMSVEGLFLVVGGLIASSRAR